MSRVLEQLRTSEAGKAAAKLKISVQGKVLDVIGEIQLLLGRELTVAGITLPPQTTWAKPVCWLYTILVDADKFGLSRDELIAVMRAEDIDSRPVFPPIGGHFTTTLARFLL